MCGCVREREREAQSSATRLQNTARQPLLPRFQSVFPRANDRFKLPPLCKEGRVLLPWSRAGCYHARRANSCGDFASAISARSLVPRFSKIQHTPGRGERGGFDVSCGGTLDLGRKSRRAPAIYFTRETRNGICSWLNFICSSRGPFISRFSFEK